MSDTARPTSVRLPVEVTAALRERAARERRSFNSQLVVTLEAGLAGLPIGDLPEHEQHVLDELGRTLGAREVGA